MKKYAVVLLVAVLGYCVWLACRPTPLTPQQVSRLDAAHNVDQLILVGAVGGSDALLTFYEKRGPLWQEVFTSRAYIGRNGLGKEREGDARTPVGVFHFTKAFGIAPDPGCALHYTQVNDAHYWVGDNASPLYNRFADTRDGAVFDRKESEHLIEYTKPYQYCLNISYNEDGKPGLGSAIFLHCYSARAYTGGCVAIPEDDMRRLLRALRPGCRIVIAELKDLNKF
ncbi:MAG: L,D-transpeptidase family protein [Desulfovibrio sp.]|nr:L,D-transpeptidase family protein [Desulfovibrio sp.]